MNGKIYQITNLIDGKRYIGQTRRNNPVGRWYRHQEEVRKGNSRHLYNAIRKYGLENFCFKVIIDNIQTQEELDKLENIQIEVGHTTDRKYGYNNEKYARGTGPVSEETRKKLSNSLKGRISPMKGRHHSLETKMMMSKTNSGENNPFFNKRHSNKTKNIIKAKRKNQIITIDSIMKGVTTRRKNGTLGLVKEESKRKMVYTRKKNNSYVVSDSTREKLRLINLGSHHSEETKKKMSSSHKTIKFKAISPIGEEFMVNGISAFSKKYNLHGGVISSCLQGKRKTCKGWTFKRLEEIN